MPNIINYGGPVMYPLVLCSITALTVIIERAVFWLKLKKNSNSILVNQVIELSAQQEWNTIKEKVKGSKDHIVRVLISGILHKEFSMSKAMESAAIEEIRKMSRYMTVIDTIITASPLLGIFGTVIGIIASFDALGTGGIGHPQAVTGGIAQALITTAAGLAIAIFSVFPYNFFNSLIETAARDIEKYATSLEVVCRDSKK